MTEKPDAKATPDPAAAENHEAALRDIQNRFTFHPPKPGQGDRYDFIRTQFRVLATTIISMTPVSREQETALTHLDAAMMFANAAIARRE
ncbi:MAG TPA: hypothetical protein VII52_06355 [Gemmatimonadaceae bacterium]